MDVVELMATIGLSFEEEDWNRVNEAIEKARGGLEKLHAEQDRPHKKKEEGEGNLGKELKEGLEGLFGYEGIKSIKEMVEGTVSATIAAKHLGERLGITSEAVQALGYAARLNGASQEVMTVGLQRLSYSLQSAGVHSKAFAATLSKIGLSAAQLKGHKLDENLEVIADKFKAMKDGPDKVAASMQLFGRTAGPQLIPLLNQGKEGIKELREEAEKLGVTTGEHNVEEAEKYERAMAKFHAQLGAVKDAIVFTLLPALTRLLGLFSDIIGFFKKNSDAVRPVIVAIAAAITYLLIPSVKNLGKAITGAFGQFIMRWTIITTLVRALWALFDHGSTTAKVVVGVILAALSALSIYFAITGGGASKMWAKILGPYYLLLPIIGLVIAGAKMLIDYFGGVQQIWHNITEGWHGFIDGVEEAGTAIKEGMEKAWTYVRNLPVVKQIIDGIHAVKSLLGGGSDEEKAKSKWIENRVNELQKQGGKFQFRWNALDQAKTDYEESHKKREPVAAMQRPIAAGGGAHGGHITVTNHIHIDAKNMDPHQLTRALDDHAENQRREAANHLQRGGK